MTKIFKGGQYQGFYEPGYPKTEYVFALYPDEVAARTDYEFEKGTFTPVYMEAQANDWSYFLTYIDMPRSDPEGFCRPLPYYYSRANFLSHNLLIRVTVMDGKPTSEALAASIQYLVDLLAREFEKDHTGTEKPVAETGQER